MSQILEHTPNNIERAANDLLAGKLVAMPTETVYGLAGDATNDQAIALIYSTKGRPEFNPLIVHVLDQNMAAAYVDLNDPAKKLAAAFWPGPLTMVLPRKSDSHLSHLLSAGLDTLAVRSPVHPVARDLLKTCNKPLAAPSANPSGGISPTNSQHVQQGLGEKIDLILEGGDCQKGIESTIVLVTNDQLILLRPGSISPDQLSEVTGLAIKDKEDGGINAPGQLSSHYAPHASVRLNAFHKMKDEVFIGFGALDGDFNLSELGDLEEAAANLFKTLHMADATGVPSIAIAPIPWTGLGIAINDRLERAAAPRES